MGSECKQFTADSSWEKVHANQIVAARDRHPRDLLHLAVDAEVMQSVVRHLDSSSKAKAGGNDWMNDWICFQWFS